MRSQPKLRKGILRIPSASSLAPAIRRAVEHEAARYKVSKSFVMAVAIADAMGLDVERYDIPVKRKEKRK